MTTSPTPRTQAPRLLRTPVRIALALGVISSAAVLAATAFGALTTQSAVSQQTAVSSTIHAFVHPDSSIGTTFDDGSAAGTQATTPPTIPAGTYSLVVLDDTPDHNFHILGPGVERQTDILGTGTTNFSITLQAGATYRYVCDLHADFMFGAFKAAGADTSSSSSGGSASSGGSTSSGGNTTGTTSNAGSAVKGTLAGTIPASGTAKLTLGRKTITRLAAGRYKITAADKSKTSGLILQRKGSSAITISSTTFVGTATKTVALSAGKWTISTSTGHAIGSFTVA